MTTAPPTQIPPPVTDIEVDIDLAIKALGFRWHDMGLQPDGARHYLLADQLRIQGFPVVDLPPMNTRGGIMFNPRGERVAVQWLDMPRPSADIGQAWNILRHVNRQHRVGVVVDDCPADLFTGERFPYTVSWFKPNAQGKLGSDCEQVCTAADRTLERAVSRGLLVLLETLAHGPSASVHPAAPSQPPPAPSG